MRENNVFKSYRFTKLNLINILETLKKDDENNDFEDFAEWCHSFWSNWRSDNDDLFDRTEEVTIDTVIEIYECKTQGMKISKKQIEGWMTTLK